MFEVTVQDTLSSGHYLRDYYGKCENPHGHNYRVLITLVGELSTQSELFRQHWASHNVKFHRSGRKRLRHPAVGELDLNFEAMELPSEPDLRLNLYTAAPDTPAADGLKLLASWAATRAVDNTDTRDAHDVRTKSAGVPQIDGLELG